MILVFIQMESDDSKHDNSSIFIKMPLKFNIKTKKDVVVVKPSFKFDSENDANIEDEEERGIKRAIVSLENGIIKGYVLKKI